MNVVARIGEGKGHKGAWAGKRKEGGNNEAEADEGVTRNYQD